MPSYATSAINNNKKATNYNPSMFDENEDYKFDVSFVVYIVSTFNYILRFSSQRNMACLADHEELTSGKKCAFHNHN